MLKNVKAFRQVLYNNNKYLIKEYRFCRMFEKKIKRFSVKNMQINILYESYE